MSLGTLGGATSQAYGVNERGQVFGYSETAAGTTHAFVWEDGEMTDLGDDAVVRAINDRGQIVGTSGDGAFLWEDGEMTELDAAIPGASTSAVDINDRGQVLGTAYGPDRPSQIVIWSTR